MQYYRFLVFKRKELRIYIRNDRSEGLIGYRGGDLDFAPSLLREQLSWTPFIRQPVLVGYPCAANLQDQLVIEFIYPSHEYFTLL